MTADTLVRKGRKYDQVLDGARDIFLRDGFEGASVDEIARAAGVSKATLYSYFPDKSLLFLEVARAQCQHQSDVAHAEIDLADPPRIVLGQIARTLLSFMLSPMGQRIFRMCVAESDRFPQLGREFYRSGPLVLKVALVGYLTAAHERGEVVCEDLDFAAEQFAALCKADLWHRLLFGIQSEFSQPEIDRIADGAVETFMARYGP